MAKFDLSDSDSVDRAVLARTPNAEVTESLRALCTGVERAGYADFDELMKVGILLRMHPARCDRAAIDWLAEAPSHQRLDIVSAFLCGAWLPLGALPVEPELVAKFAHSRPAEKGLPDAEYGYALALDRVLENPHASPEAAGVARAEIRKVSERGTGDPMLDKQLLTLAKRDAERLERVDARSRKRE